MSRTLPADFPLHLVDDLLSDIPTNIAQRHEAVISALRNLFLDNPLPSSSGVEEIFEASSLKLTLQLLPDHTDSTSDVSRPAISARLVNEVLSGNSCLLRFGSDKTYRLLLRTIFFRRLTDTRLRI